MASSSRQRVGLACEGCRRRKARCDAEGNEGPCGGCLELGLECVFEGYRSKRGPKKGQVTALKARIATLERQLFNLSRAGQTGVTTTNGSVKNDGFSIANAVMLQAGWNQQFESPSQSIIQAGWQDEGTTSQPQSQLTFIESDNVSISPLKCDEMPNTISNSEGLSHLMELDLDQLYFDRVHPMLPMVHRLRYLSWARLDDVPLAKRCLRWAMRALAASVSSQFRFRSEEFYHRARRLTEHLEASDLAVPWPSTDVAIEQVQTWLLLAHFEVLHSSECWRLSTTRAIHLVHLSRLNGTDPRYPAPDFPPHGPETFQLASLSFASLEERRRTFWVAFCLDRFLGGYEESPMSFQHETISVRIPCPEWNFQTSSPVEMGFVDDILIGQAPIPVSSPFATLVIGMSLFGQCVLHKQVSINHPASNEESQAFWAHHEWLAGVIDKQVTLLPRGPTELDDNPLHLITLMTIYGSALALSNAASLADFGSDSQQLVVGNYKDVAYKAAISMADLSESTAGSSCFKTHIYLPMFLTKGFLYLTAHPAMDRSQQPSQAKLIAWLESLKEINGQAKQFIDGLELWDGVNKMEIGAIDFHTWSS